ncbi:hypothetical protein T12_6210 [Trichinella patagoniensis]|uniref:Uncharacterized protein n=1 Tax=Trichinella patagoniensis TaxID=990121 RepID=A0A0V1AFP2_9BILA|nr:hypothetical protein T12_6210 [Trichinella patagoniensis]
MINFKRYKCYYDRENYLEDISPMNLLRSLFLPLKSYQRAIFLAISRQIRIYETSDQKMTKEFNNKLHFPRGMPLLLLSLYANMSED